MISFLTKTITEQNISAFTDVQDPFVCLTLPDMLPDDHWVRSVEKFIGRHPDYDVYHVNVKGEPAFPRRTSADKFFRLVFLKGRRVPPFSFVFRWETFKEKAVFRADGSLDPLATVMACAQRRPIRSVWLLKMACPPFPVLEGAAADARIWERIELFRWTEGFFGEEDYPLGVGESLNLFAATLVKLYPGRTEDELKTIMSNFQLSRGPLRKMRAANALKNALKERKKELQ